MILFHMGKCCVGAEGEGGDGLLLSDEAGGSLLRIEYFCKTDACDWNLPSSLWGYSVR